jgi:hypothetical protein
VLLVLAAALSPLEPFDSVPDEVVDEEELSLEEDPLSLDDPLSPVEVLEVLLEPPRLSVL